MEISVTIHKAAWQDIPQFWDMAARQGISKPSHFFEDVYELQEKGKRELLWAEVEQAQAGFVILNWFPKYPPFKKLEIPEIQDLNVLPDFRRRGVGAAMMKYCEGLAREKGYKHMGIGVGLYSSYGPAQRLYVRRGYVPDGAGVNYDRQTMGFGEMRPNDDDLCLMLVKEL